MSENLGGAEKPVSWTPEERIILVAFSKCYKANPGKEDIYSRALAEAEPRLEELRAARQYQEQAEAYRIERDKHEQCETEQRAQRDIEDDDAAQLCRLRDRLEPLIAAYLAGDVTEFPGGREPEEEIVYIQSDYPHPDAVPDHFTDAEWAQIAGMQAGAWVWNEAAQDGSEGAETIRGVARPFVLRNLGMAADEWDERTAGLPHALSYYLDGEFNTSEDQPPAERAPGA